MCPKSNKKKDPTIPVEALVNAAILTTALGAIGRAPKARSATEGRMEIARRRLYRGKVKRRYVNYLF